MDGWPFARPVAKIVGRSFSRETESYIIISSSSASLYANRYSWFFSSVRAWICIKKSVNVPGTHFVYALLKRTRFGRCEFYFGGISLCTIWWRVLHSNIIPRHHGYWRPRLHFNSPIQRSFSLFLCLYLTRTNWDFRPWTNALLSNG